MRRFALTLLAALVLAAQPAAAANGAEGVWVMKDDSARIRIAPCPDQADRLCGTIVSVKPRPPGQTAPKRKDGSPAPSQKSMVGHMLMVGFKPNGPGKWNGGKVQIPGSDRTVDAKMSLNKDGTLHVSGCVMVLCGSQDWRPA